MLVCDHKPSIGRDIECLFGRQWTCMDAYGEEGMPMDSENSRRFFSWSGKRAPNRPATRIPVRTSCTGSRRPHWAARAADSARTPQLPLTLPLRRRLEPVGWRGDLMLGPRLEPPGGLRAAADLTREPSRRPTSGTCGRAEASPIREQAYGPPPLVKSAAPSARS